MSSLRSVAMLVMCLSTACARDRSTEQEESSEAALRSEASIYLERARLAHAAADAAATNDARARALDTLSTLAEQAPSTLAPADAAVLRRDLYGHAAKLAFVLTRYEQADAWIAKGLALPGQDSFRTQLALLAVEVRRALGDVPGEAAAITEARRALGTGR